MNKYKFFTFEELKCKCGNCDYGQDEMNPEFMGLIVEIRFELDFPFPVHSAFRCVRYDREIGGAGIHPTGECIDIGVYGFRAWKLVQAATRKGITGIGVKQHGSPHAKRFVHLDIVEATETRPRPFLWSYP